MPPIRTADPRLIAAAALMAALLPGPARAQALAPPAKGYGARPPASVLCEPSAWPLPVDGGLCEAARLLAAAVAAQPASSEAERARMAAFYLRRQGIADAQVRTFAFRAEHLGTLFERVEARARASGGARLGVGLWPEGGETRAVLMLARGLAELEPLPRHLPAPGIVRLSGRLAEGARAPQGWLAAPSGAVFAVPLTVEGRRFEAALALDGPGRWDVELLVDAGEGPEAAILAPVYVAVAEPETPEPPLRDGPGDPAAQVHQALADLRRQLRLPAAARDAVLDRVAAGAAEAVAARGRPVHRPEGAPDAETRLREAGYAFAWVAEDLAQGPGALAAFQALLESPAHRRLLVDPRARRAGVGLARRGALTWLALHLAEPMAAAPVAPGPSQWVIEARLLASAEEAIQALRVRQGLGRVLRDPHLDDLASEYARHLARRDLPEDPAFAGRLRGRVRAEDVLAGEVRVEVVVAGRPELAARASAPAGRACDRLGLGIQRAASRRFGGERLWIAAICVDHGRHP